MDEGRELDEAPAELEPLDQFKQDGDSQVSLADAGRPHEQETRLAKADPLLDELVDVLLSSIASRHELRLLAEPGTGDGEVRQPAVAIAGRDPRGLDQPGQ